MPTPPTEPFRVAVYSDDDDGLRRAEAALRAVRPDKTTVFSDVVEGWITADGYKQLVSDGLIVDITDPLEQDDLKPDEPLADVRAATPAHADLDQFKAEARNCVLTDERGFVVEAAEVEVDPCIHASAGPTPVDVYWVRLKRPLAPHHRAELSQSGIEISGYQPPNLYKMFLSQQQREEMLKQPFVAAVDRYTLEQTATPHLVDAVVNNPAGPQLLADAEAPRSEFDCVLHRARDLDRVRTILEQTEGVDLVSGSAIFIRFSAPAGAPFLAALAQLPEVRKLAPHQPPTLLVDCARRIVGVEGINSPPPEKWTGAGERVGIFDSGIDETHPDLADRIHSAVAVGGGATTDLVGHGTHVAGIIAGTGVASSGAVRGVAPEAELVVVRVTKDDGTLDVPPDLGELLALATQQDAKVINLSWGSPLSGDYDIGSLSIDRFSCEHPDVLVIVAAGNAGEAPEGYVTLKSVFSPASAKNALTVGASATDRKHDPALNWGDFRPPKFPREPSKDESVCGDANLLAAISSRGPTDFDSVKPDLLAPGTFILAARAADVADRFFWEPHPDHGGRYAFNGGTSMAAPVVTGSAALVRQYCREEKAGQAAPSSALVKAILLASAMKLPSGRPSDQQERVGYPDFDQGFGRVDLSKVLPGAHAPKLRLEVADIANDSPEALESRSPLGAARKSVRTHVVEVANDATEVRVVLAWTDRPGRYVQNNLELDVRGPDGSRLLGNSEHKFRKDPLFDDPQLTGVIFDKRNNVEQVVLTKPAAGRYRLRVWAENTLSPQGYALCIAGELSSELTDEV